MSDLNLSAWGLEGLCIISNMILDNSFNYYPKCNNDDYYPRPVLNETKNEYIHRIKTLRKKVTMTNSLREFLLRAYDINSNHRHAISLLEPKIKHKINEKAQNVREQRCVYRVATTGKSNPVIMNSDGSVDNGKIIHVEKGADVHIEGSVLKSPDQTIHIQNLRSYPVNNGIIDFGGEKRKMTEWMADCILICQELIAQIR